MDWIEPLLAVFAVLLLLIGVLFWMRRMGWVQGGGPVAFRPANRRMAVLERLPLSPQHALHLVRIGEQVFLVGVSPQGCTLIDHPALTDLKDHAVSSGARP